MVRRLDYAGPDPIWRLMAMTRAFGPVGSRWGADQVDWRMSKTEAEVCFRAWWTDPQTSERRFSRPCWAKAPLSSDCLSIAADKALDLALQEAEESMTFRLVPLSRGAAALVDAEDYPVISRSIWSVLKTKHGRYAVRGIKPDGKGKMILMHRQIMNPSDAEQVDHWDHDGLNNRRSNLRVCTNKQNVSNTRSRPGSSRFKGVCRTKTPGRWSAQIMVNGKKKHLGTFPNEIDAALAYDSAAREFFGSFAHTNF